MTARRVAHDLRIDSGGDAFVVSGPQPHLSWKLPDGWSSQESYELDAQIDGVAQPTVVADSAAHLFVDWPWRPLTSGEAVLWRVRPLRADNTCDWSDWAGFEAGLFDPDWTSAWISPNDATSIEPGNRPAFALSTTFQTKGAVARARLYSTALGVYEAFVNGERAGTAELAPGSTSYDETLYAQATDVTDALTAGDNTVEILLSDGWYRGKVGVFQESDNWGALTAARLELHVLYTNGTAEKILTGSDWVSRRSRITRADLMTGQATDFTFVDPEPRPVVVDSIDAPTIHWSPAPPVRNITQLKPKSMSRTPNGAYIIDFGQNVSGWITLTNLGPAGTTTRIEYGEHLDPDGDLTNEHLNSDVPGWKPVVFSQCDEVTSAGDPRDAFEPRHTVHGFQYVRITRAEVELDIADVVAQAVHTDLPKTGTFACSNDDLNRLHAAADWSFRGNAVDVPTDCPTRERAGWTGDYQVFAPTAAYLYDINGFSKKWLRSVVDDQLDDGRVANISPDPARLRVLKKERNPNMPDLNGSSGWGDAIVLVPWALYQSYGDRHVLTDCWESMTRWVEFALRTAREARHPSRIERSPDPRPHEEFIWDGSFHWGEWLEPKKRRPDGSFIDPVHDDPQAWFTADKGEVGTAYLYRSLQILSEVAGVLGRYNEAGHYKAIAAKVRQAWQIEFLDAEGRTAAGTQASYVRALRFELVPDDLRDRAAEHLVALIRDADMHLGTGFLSTADLLPVLADTGHTDIAYALLFQRTSPSWLGMLDRGATTIWEDWDGVDENGKASASLNHYSKGAVVRFLHTHTLGLRQQPGSVAWESFLVAPVIDDSLSWAKGSFESPQGTINVNWEIEDGSLSIEVDVPSGSGATIVFPGGETITHGPGCFRQRRRLADAEVTS